MNNFKNFNNYEYCWKYFPKTSKTEHKVYGVAIDNNLIDNYDKDTYMLYFQKLNAKFG